MRQELENSVAALVVPDRRHWESKSIQRKRTDRPTAVSKGRGLARNVAHGTARRRSVKVPDVARVEVAARNNVDDRSARSLASVSRSQPSKLTLQRVDLCKVVAGVVVAASLAASESEAPARIFVAGAVSAQVDDRREVLPLL